MIIGGVQMKVELPTGRFGIVVAKGCRTEASSGALAEALSDACEAAKERIGTDETIKQVRDLFRHGKYKPTGRGKPASEYLIKAAREDRFPRINNLVDINNLISLQTLLPISLVDLARAETSQFTLRHGHPEESYIFNATGQSIGLQDLIVVARMPEDEACANAIKDSMATKLGTEATAVMAVLYAPETMAAEVQAATARFADLLTTWGGAQQVHHAVLTAAPDPLNP